MNPSFDFLLRPSKGSPVFTHRDYYFLGLHYTVQPLWWRPFLPIAYKSSSTSFWGRVHSRPRRRCYHHIDLEDAFWGHSNWSPTKLKAPLVSLLSAYNQMVWEMEYWGGFIFKRLFTSHSYWADAAHQVEWGGLQGLCKVIRGWGIFIVG